MEICGGEEKGERERGRGERGRGEGRGGERERGEGEERGRRGGGEGEERGRRGGGEGEAYLSRLVVVVKLVVNQNFSKPSRPHERHRGFYLISLIINKKINENI